MSDGQVFTSTPDTVSGNAIAVVAVTNSASQVVNQQIVTVGDATDGTLQAAVTASGLQVQTGPVVVSGGVTAVQATAANLNATVAQGAAGASAWIISGAVTVTGPVTVANAVVLATGATQVGFVAQGAAGSTAWKVDGSGVTQPVTIATALPAGSAAIGLVAQGAVGTTAWKVDGSGVTQPVTLATALPAGSAAIGLVAQGAVGTTAWKVDGSGVTQPVTLATALPAGSAAIGLVAQGAVGTTAWKVDGSGVTQPVTLATSLPAGSAVIGALSASTSNIGVITEHMDVSRTNVTLFYKLTCVVTEALATMQINKGGTVTSGTTYVVTTGKTLRIESIALALFATGATANSTTINLRSAATVTVASPLMNQFFLGVQAVAGSMTVAHAQIPDGLEIASAQQIGISHTAAAAISSENINIWGFEY